MRFCLIDRICFYEPGAQLTAVKNVTLAEEYLSDHFPSFPVLPGVFMLEAITQAGAWLVRLTDDFSHSMILLKQARNVKYAEFVSPGSQLQVTVNLSTHDATQAVLKGQGAIDGKIAVSAKLVLSKANLSDKNPEKAVVDQQITRHLRTLGQALLGDPQ